MARILITPELEDKRVLAQANELNAKLNQLFQGKTIPVGKNDGLKDMTKSGEKLLRVLEEIEAVNPNLRKIINNVSGVDKNLHSAAESAKVFMDSFMQQEASARKINTAVRDRIDLMTGVSREASKITAEASAFNGAASETNDSLGKIIGKVATWGIATTAIYGTIKLVKTAVGDIAHTLQDVEDQVIGLQRVLNTDISDNAVGKELLAIAGEFGNARGDVAAVATTWAQAGYEWNDVLDLTKGTMLALNTAELDLEQSTSDLIAIMKQYKLEVSDYPELIDLINYTADNYSVTSAAIVAALQKTGSTLAGYNVTLEQSIALTTGLSQATGASGSMLGNALKALTTYTTKGKALDIFSQLSEDMNRTVELYRAGAKSVYDIWKQLSVEMGDLTMQQADVLESWFDSEDYRGFADELEEEATDVTNTITDIYGTAGTYRKNYFIALLNNFETVENALADMADASGHSMEEQEKYAQSYTAKVHELRAAWEELIIAEGGFLDFMKGFVDALADVSRFVGDIGGLKVAVSGLLGVLLALGSEKILGFFGTLRKFMGLSDWKELPVKVKMLGAELKALFVVGDMGAAAFLSWVGIITTAVTAIVSAANMIKNKLHEQREALMDAGEAAAEEAESLQKLYAAYVQAAEGSQEAIDASAALAEALGVENDGVTDLTTAYKELIAAKEAETRLAERAARKDLESFWNLGNYRIDFAPGGLSSDVRNRVSRLGNQVSVDDPLAASSFATLYPSDRSAEGLAKYIDGIKELITYIGQKNDAEEADLRLAEQLQAVYDRNKEAVDAYRQAIENELNLGATNIFNTMYLDEVAEGGQEAFDRIAAAIDKDTSLTREWRDALLSVMEDAFPNLAEESVAIERNTESVEEQAGAVESLAASINDLQEQYKILTTAQDELSESGTISAKTFQEIVDNGLLGYLENTEDGLRVNTNALLASAESAKEKALADLQAGLAADILKLAEQEANEEVAVSEGISNSAATAADNLAAALGSVSPAALSAGAAIRFYNSMGQSTGTLEGKEAEIAKLVDSYKTAAAQISAISIGGTSGGGKGGSGGSGKTKTAAEIRQEELDDWLNDTKHTIYLLEQAEGDHNNRIVELYRSMQAKVHDMANYYRSLGYKDTDKEIQELQKLWWGYEKEIQDVYSEVAKAAEQALEEVARKQKELLSDFQTAMNDVLSDYRKWMDGRTKAIDKEIDALKAQQEAYEDQKDALEEEKDLLDEEIDRLKDLRDEETSVLDEQINALKEAHDLREAEDELAEHQLRIEEARLAVLEAEQNLLAAQNERTVRYFNSDSGQWEWMADQNAVRDAEDALADARKNLADAESAMVQYLEDAAYQDAINALEAQKQVIKAHYDNLIDGIESQQDEIDSQKKLLDKQKNLLNGEIDILKDRQAALRDEYNAFAEEWESIIDSMQAPAQSMSAILSDIATNGTAEMKAAVQGIVSALDGLEAYLAGYGEEGIVPEHIVSAAADWSSDVSRNGIYKVLADGSAPPGLKVGDQVVTGGGTYSIVEANTPGASYNAKTGYWSLLSDPNQTTHNYTGPYGVFDSGGFAFGQGQLLKRTDAPETILDPELTKAILSPVTDANYTRVREFLQLSANLADGLRHLPDASISGFGLGGGNNDNRRIYYFNGVQIGRAEAEGTSLAQIAERLATDLPLV